MFSAIENSSTSPRRWRSSGMWPRPESKCSWTPTFVTSCPSTTTEPPSTRRRPVIASISSVWPLPSIPAMPTISPARTSNETPRTFSIPRSSKTWRPSTPSNGSAGLASALVDAEQDVAADHQPGEALLRGALGRQRLDELAPAQHRDAVGDLCDLVQLVADEDDGLPLRGEAAHDLEQLPRLLRGEHCRRLVERRGCPRCGTAPSGSRLAAAARR